MKADFIYLNEKQMIEAGVKDLKRCNDAIEYMFRLQHIGDYREGGDDNDAHGLRIVFPKESSIPNMPLHSPGRWFSAMPAYLGGKYHAVGIKCYGANQANPQLGVPRSVLMMSLLDAESGLPFAYMSANILSAARTGAVSGLYARYMAPKSARKIAVIGPGVMSRYSLDSIMLECPNIEHISVLGRGRKGLDSFKNHCKEKGYNFKTYTECQSVEDVCKNADIILTANSKCSTHEEYPYVKQEYLKKNALVIVVAVIRFDKQMFLGDDAVFITDDKRMYMQDGAIDSHPVDANDPSATYISGLCERIEKGLEVTDMSEIVCDESFVRDENKIYFCASTGMPIEDVAWACECYEVAKAKGIGIVLDLWDEPELL